MATLCVKVGKECKTPTDTAIKSLVNSELFGKGDGTFTVSDPVAGTGFRDLSVRYTKTMNFIFFPGPTITLNRSKRAYVADTTPPTCATGQVNNAEGICVAS